LRVIATHSAFGEVLLRDVGVASFDCTLGQLLCQLQPRSNQVFLGLPINVAVVRYCHVAAYFAGFSYGLDSNAMDPLFCGSTRIEVSRPKQLEPRLCFDVWVLLQSSLLHEKFPRLYEVGLIISGLSTNPSGIVNWINANPA